MDMCYTLDVCSTCCWGHYGLGEQIPLVEVNSFLLGQLCVVLPFLEKEVLIICEGVEIKMPFVYLKFEVSN